MSVVSVLMVLVTRPDWQKHHRHHQGENPTEPPEPKSQENLLDHQRLILIARVQEISVGSSVRLLRQAVISVSTNINR